jgi:BirA family transcriptional regulator, biotin operon repressor / biotin---[acetyl-CoA-carboxylase] ligase
MMLPDWRVTRHASLPSTSDVILARIRAGEAQPGEVVAAAVQTAGRGRQGRRWVSEPGGLWLTAALPVGGLPLGQPALVAAVAACEAVRVWVPEAGLKWPNDLNVRDRKVGGILVERLSPAELAAVGIGINVTGCPALDGEPSAQPAALAEFAETPVTPDDLLPVLLEALRRRWEEWHRGGWPTLREAWRRMDAARGRAVRVVPPGIDGRAEGIDDDGALRVRRPDGSVLVATVGEVLFL